MAVDGCEISHLLNWQNSSHPAASGHLTSKTAKKDFIRGNIQSVRSLRTDVLNMPCMLSHNNYATTKPGIFERISDGITSKPTQKNEIQCQGSFTEPYSQTKCIKASIVNQSKQAGVLRTPRETNRPDQTTASSEIQIPVQSLAPASTLTRADVPRASSAKDIRFIRRDVNYLLENANAVSSGCVLDRRGKNSLPSSVLISRQGSIGKIPLYLIRRRKEEEEKARAVQKAIEEDAIRPGHRKVPNEERLNTLQKLEEVRVRILKELGRVPIGMTTTIRARNHRSELENRLSDVEEMISAFSKPTVFIKLDQ